MAPNIVQRGMLIFFNSNYLLTLRAETTRTSGWTKSPLLLFIVVPLCGTPQLAICTTVLCALSVPLLVEPKWELTGASERIAP